MNHKIDDAATATDMQDHSEHKPSHSQLGAHEGYEPSGHGTAGGMVPALASTRVTTWRCSDSGSFGACC